MSESTWSMDASVNSDCIRPTKYFTWAAQAAHSADASAVLLSSGRRRVRLWTTKASIWPEVKGILPSFLGTPLTPLRVAFGTDGTYAPPLH
jgi:hypothetical protein